ncbi:hypothetical protein M9H77_16231 [Catharanthus roseus]|uniref:Uncharacterized protein n=1 Tax=Catharanthus roseus TaxID=4058 RepID=A0ACC0B124_CATRO|nr:hypothetical protein M9H77_16231 [Catharanthus roseus]
MLNRCTLDLDPVNRGRSTVEGPETRGTQVPYLATVDPPKGYGFDSHSVERTPSYLPGPRAKSILPKSHANPLPHLRFPNVHVPHDDASHLANFEIQHVCEVAVNQVVKRKRGGTYLPEIWAHNKDNPRLEERFILPPGAEHWTLKSIGKDPNDVIRMYGLGPIPSDVFTNKPSAGKCLRMAKESEVAYYRMEEMVLSQNEIA